ncbi:MAG: CpsB/CapC family capsule biosynthesis tyrosine phosphatase [Erysipelotrichaceae bacterium]|nr:CpsB/CapC family capsule biosynthesis tyrosine phosphatase [Erysipelotrichaceae bacterium]
MKNKFVDTHCHALWDFDDGVKSMDESLALLRCAQITGIVTLFVTPHINGIYNPTQEEIKSKTQELIDLKNQNSIPIEVKYACEFRVSDESMQEIIDKKYVCYQDTDYLLVEFVRRIIDLRLIEDALYELKILGVKPIIAHPERYFDSERQAIDYCKKWLSWGAFFQINRTSLLGFHGERIDKISWRLVSEGLAHIVASDAHQGEGRRECRLDDVHGAIERRFTTSIADDLCIHNPKALSLNEELKQISVKKPWWHKK